MGKSYIEENMIDGRWKSGSVPMELKFDDDYISSMVTRFNTYATELQNCVDEYVKILNDIRMYAILEGETAAALDKFMEYTNVLKEVIAKSGTDAKIFCENFVTLVDEKDDLFY